MLDLHDADSARASIFVADLLDVYYFDMFRLRPLAIIAHDTLTLFRQHETHISGRGRLIVLDASDTTLRRFLNAISPKTAISLDITHRLRGCRFSI